MIAPVIALAWSEARKAAVRATSASRGMHAEAARHRDRRPVGRRRQQENRAGALPHHVPSGRPGGDEVGAQPGLEPILIALGSWALRSELPAAGPISPTSAMLTLRTYHRPADDWPDVVEVRFGERRYRVGVADEQFVVALGEAPPGAVVVATEPGTFVERLAGQRTVGPNIWR